MKTGTALILTVLLPAQALAGAQYSAEDVIRYFEALNAPAHSAPASNRGLVTGEPAASAPSGGVVVADPAAPAPKGLLVGAPSKGAMIGGAPDGGDSPLAIPMTGAKAGHSVAPAVAVAAAPTAAAAAAPAAAAGYDLMVTFEIDSATLTPQARQNLDAFARALADPALAELRFAVEGHTDATGSAEHNLALSQARAASVVGYLVENGVEPARLTSAGYGETRPRVADPEHGENRRVETRRID